MRDQTYAILTIIPARGGSKGIPRKNVRLLAGKPLLAHSIEQAQQSCYVNRVVISTDDSEIATVSQQYSAEVIWRPAEISGDNVPSELALLHTLNFLKQTEFYDPDLVVFLQATSPCRLTEDIDGAITMLLQENADSVFSAYPEHFTGRWRKGNQTTANPINYKLGFRPIRQDYPIEYLENGSIYCFRPRVIHETGNRLGGKIVVYEMPLWRSFQVDHPDDFLTLEILLSLSQQLRHGQVD